MATPAPAIDTASSRVGASNAVSADCDAPLPLQQDFWNAWNGIFVGSQRGPISQRQARVVEDWLMRSGRTDLRILEVGCGTGWMTGRLRHFGQTTGTDLSDAVLAIAQQAMPDARFIAGDFMALDLPRAHFDVIVTLEVLSHVRDQAAFIQRMADLLKPGGQLMLATQNRPVLERCEDVAVRAEGQIRQWVDRHDLRRLVQHRFVVDELFSICPHGHLGMLRVVNSTKLNTALSAIVPAPAIERAKERAWLGHTLMLRARVRSH